MSLLMQAILGATFGPGPDREDFGSDEAFKSFERASAMGEAAGMASGIPIVKRLFGGGRAVLNSMPEALRGVGEFFSREMPEVFAKVGYTDMPPNASALGSFMEPVKAGQIGEIAIHPSVMEHGSRFDQLETLGHEMTHAQQALDRAIRQGRYYDLTPFDEAYELETALRGYSGNKFEVDARIGGQKAANKDYWASRSTPDQPTFPEMGTPADIAEWSVGNVTGRSTAWSPRIQDWIPDPVGYKKVWEIRGQGGPIAGDPDFEATRRRMLNARFGSSPTGLKQQRLPLDVQTPGGPEFTAVGDESPRTRVQFKEPPRVPEKAPYRDPKFAGRSDAAFEGGQEIDLSSISSIFGREGVRMRLGENPVLIFKPKGGHGAPTEESIPYEVAMRLLQELQRRQQRGLMTDARGVRRRLPGRR